MLMCGKSCCTRRAHSCLPKPPVFVQYLGLKGIAGCLHLFQICMNVALDSIIVLYKNPNLHRVPNRIPKLY